MIEICGYYETCYLKSKYINWCKYVSATTNDTNPFFCMKYHNFISHIYFNQQEYQEIIIKFKEKLQKERNLKLQKLNQIR